jgi:hypothetical protein
LAVAVLAEGAGIIVASRLLDLPVPRILAEAVPAAIAATAMAIPLIAISLFIESSLAALLLGTAVGAVVYLLVIALVAPDSIRYLRDRLLSSTPQGPSPESLAVPHETDVIA